MAVPGISADIFDLPMQQNAIIVCTTERSTRFLKDGITHNKLIIDFPDVEDSAYPGAFNERHAQAIIRFLMNLPEEVTDLYVCCSKGGSRSPAVAAAVLKMSGRSDWRIWKNIFYVPNTLVYERLCREAGIWTPHFMVALKKKINDLEYKKAKLLQNTGKYERWEIIE